MLMSLVLDGEATEAETVSLCQHIAVCSACAATWAQWRALDARLAAAPQVPVPPNFVANVVARLVGRRLQRRRWQWIGSGVLMAWTGVICAMGFCLAGLLSWGLAHPADGSLIVSWGARLLSNLAWLLRVLQVWVDIVGGFALGLGAGFYLLLTMGLSLLWFSVVACRLGWARAAVPAT
jgi:predicted anti-sigma-YlaC factor YlaD